MLGVALSAANPKNLALTVAAAATVAEAGLDTAEEAAAIAVFVAIGSAFVLGAVAVRLAGGERAAKPLAQIREFMAANNAVIMTVVLLLLGMKLAGDALPAI